MPAAQSPSKFPKRGRQQKNTDGFGDTPSHLVMTLNVDIEQYIMTGSLSLAQRAPRSAVKVPVNLGPFDKLVPGQHPLKHPARDESVLVPVAFARTCRPCGVRNRKTQTGHRTQEAFHQR